MATTTVGGLEVLVREVQPGYPTPEEIMAEEVFFKRELIQLVIDWKRTFFVKKWGAADAVDKVYALKHLAMAIGNFYEKEITVKLGGHYQMLGNGVIQIQANKPSIISTLHEIGHVLMGSSELEACRFSVWLFKKAFSKHYEKLVWYGHCLVQKPVEPDNEDGEEEYTPTTFEGEMLRRLMG